MKGLIKKAWTVLVKMWRSSLSGIKLVSARLPWMAKLLIASLLCAALSVVGLHLTERAEKAAKKEAQQRQDCQRREEAASSWALQQTLAGLAPNGRAPGEKDRSLKDAVQYYRAKLDLPLSSANMAETKDQGECANQGKSGREKGIVVLGIPLQTDLFIANLMTVLARGSAALLVISILCVLALIVIPFAKSLMQIGEERAKDPFKPAENKPASSAPMAPPTSFFIHRDGGLPGTEPVPPPPFAGAAGFSPLVRQSLIPLVLSGGVIVGIGAILVNASGRDLTVAPEVRAPNVGLQIDDFAVAVKPGRIDVPAANVIPSSTPRLLAEIPKIEVHLPVDDAQQRVVTELTDLARNLQEYGERLERKMKEQQDEVLRLSRANAKLQVQLEIRPTRKEVDELAKRVAEQNDLQERWRSTLEQTNATLDKNLTPLLTVAESKKNGDRVVARQVTRDLNAQNEHLFNQIFRPGFVRRNCETYRKIATEFGDVPVCTDTWFYDRLFRRKAKQETATQSKPPPTEVRVPASPEPGSDE